MYTIIVCMLHFLTCLLMNNFINIMRDPMTFDLTYRNQKGSESMKFINEMTVYPLHIQLNNHNIH